MGNKIDFSGLYKIAHISTDPADQFQKGINQARIFDAGEKVKQKEEEGEFRNGSGKSYALIYNEIINFHREFRLKNAAVPIDAFWEMIAERIAEFNAKYNDDPFVSELVNAVFNELERINSKGKNN